jgi:hypothetical protein
MFLLLKSIIRNVMGRRKVYVLVALLIASLLFGGCAKYKQIRPVSAGVESIMPNGLRSVVVNLRTEIDNPATQVTLTDVEGLIERSGKVLGRVSLDPFILEAKTLKEYHLRAIITLDQGTTLFDVMSLASKTALEECKADVSFKVTLKGGLSKKMSYEDIPLSRFMKM